MRVERERKKKLIVAFHFVCADGYASQPRWNCESCRRQGLDKKRQCGFMAGMPHVERGIVWGRRGTHTDECPKSLITGESLALVEEFLVRQRLGIPMELDTEARKVEAFLILQQEMEREQRDGTP